MQSAKASELLIMGDEHGHGGETSMTAIANSRPSQLPSPNGADSAALVTPVKEQQDDLSPPSTNLIQHMDARSRALGRKAELDELRSKRLAKNIRQEFKAGHGDSVPLSTAELTSFFLHQKEMEKEWREKQRDSIEFLHSYKNSAVDYSHHPPNEKQQVFSTSGYSEMDYLFYQKQKASEQDWREKQKMSMEYLHNYRGSGEAYSTGDDNQNVRSALVTPSGVSLVGEEYMSSIAFDELRRALADRLSIAVNCPIPDSPPLSRSEPSVTFGIDEGAHLELYLSDIDAALAHAEDDESLVTPIDVPLVGEENTSFAFDELQKALEDRLAVAVNCPRPDSPPLSPAVPTMNSDGDEGVCLSSMHVVLAGARDIDIICSTGIAGDEPSTSQEDETYNMKQEDTPEEREDTCPNELDVCDPLAEDTPHSNAKEHDPTAAHDVQQTGLLDDREESIFDKLVGSELPAEASPESDPHVGTSDENSEEPQVPSVDASSKDDEEYDAVPQRESCPAAGDLIERIVVSDLKEALVVDKDAPGDHDPSTGEDATKRDAAREANASTPATSELCDVCASMTEEYKEIDMPIAHTFPDISLDNATDVLDEMLEVEDGGTRFDRQSGVADGTKNVCALCGASRCEATAQVSQACKSIPIAKPRPKSPVTSSSRSAANKRESQAGKRTPIAVLQPISARAPARDTVNMRESQAGKRMSIAVPRISASSLPGRGPAIKRESQAGERMPITEPRSISARTPSSRSAANKRESQAGKRMPIAELSARDAVNKRESQAGKRMPMAEPRRLSASSQPGRGASIKRESKAGERMTRSISARTPPWRDTANNRGSKIIRPRKSIANVVDVGPKDDVLPFVRPVLSTPESKSDSPTPVRSPNQRIVKVDDLGANEDSPRFMRPMCTPERKSTKPILSTLVRKTESPTCRSSPKKRAPTYTRSEIARVKECSEQWILDLHSTRDGCERCLHFASAKERQKFQEAGHHYRISSVRGGCIRSCPCFPRREDEVPVRLCRRCFYDTHKLGKL